MLQCEAPGTGPGPELLAAPRDVGDEAAIRTGIAAIRLRLHDLDAEKASLETIVHSSLFEGAAVTNSSPASAKVALFRSLFKGRHDVFPVRWENRNSARAGYSPACSNEWARGIWARTDESATGYT